MVSEEIQERAKLERRADQIKEWKRQGLPVSCESDNGFGKQC